MARSAALDENGSAGATGPVRNLRDQQRETTHQRILAAAMAAFTETGVAGVTIDQIARAAGISRATLYLHFTNKEAILLALLRRDLKAVRGIYDSLPAAARGGREGVIGWIDGYVGTLRRHRADMRLFSIAAANDAEVLSLVREHHDTVVSRLLGREDKPAAPAERPLNTRALLMLDRIDRFARALSEDDPDLDPATVREILAAEITDLFARLNAAR